MVKNLILAESQKMIIRKWDKEAPMRNKMDQLIRVMLPFILLLLLSCATTKRIQPPPPDELRANLGTIGIVSASFQPEVGFQKPMTKGRAAWHGAGEGTLFVLNVGSGCTGLSCAGVLALVPVAAAVGGIVGAAKGVSSEKTTETIGALNGYLATLSLQETMRERFLSVARERTEFPFVIIEGQGPNALDEEVVYGSLSDKGKIGRAHV